MTSINDSVRREGDSLDAIFDALANRHRRRLLGVVYARAPATSTRDELARRLASGEHEKPPAQVTESERQQALIDLHHIHLPKLDAVGLVDQDTDAETVSLASHPAFEDAGVQRIIEERARADQQELDSLFQALANSLRRTILDVLSHQYQQIKTETLVREVIASEEQFSESEVDAAETEARVATLCHTHLPLLDEAGLIEYDPDEQMVVYSGHPELRVPWMHSQLGSNFRASLSEKAGESDVWTLEGRETVVSCGQSLCDEAEEELFLMFTTTGLLEAGCFARIKQAAERGVNVYLGTADPVVREFVNEETPEVTLWEPQANWLNLPVEGDRVGRLVFADREAVMLGTLGAELGDGTHEERALVGEGNENSFVVMIRQMLSSRLDQLDEEGEEALARMPF